MKKTKKKTNNHSVLILFILLVIIFIIAIIVLSMNNSNQKENGIPAEGENFSFTLLDGTVQQLSDYHGKIVILDMWATWCGPCAYQMAELKTAYDTYDRSELEIISLNIDTRENAQQITDYIEEFKNQYDIELDWIFGQDDGSVWEAYMISGGIPTLYIFDQQGNIHFSHEGVAFFTEAPDTLPDAELFGPKIDELL